MPYPPHANQAFRRKFGDRLARITVGYAGGHVPNPTYRQVCSGTTGRACAIARHSALPLDSSHRTRTHTHARTHAGHAEVVQIEYDPATLPFLTLLDFFFRSHDPTTRDRQGPDVGSQYRSCILPHTPEDEEVARTLLATLRPRFGAAGIATTVEPGQAHTFTPAEPYHQRYLEQNPHGYECPTHFERTWEQICQAFRGKM
jgi:peptide-methionine (S)-S-oxide reductase